MRASVERSRLEASTVVQHADISCLAYARDLHDSRVESNIVEAGDGCANVRAATRFRNRPLIWAQRSLIRYRSPFPSLSKTARQVHHARRTVFGRSVGCYRRGGLGNGYGQERWSPQTALARRVAASPGFGALYRRWPVMEG
jgi:hypothetical protein